MRDPEASVEFSDSAIVRTLNRPLPPEHFLLTTYARELVEAGEVVPYEFTGPLQIRAPRLSFVTYPHEWCAAQHKAASMLTLKIGERILRHGFELKDASAWNIIFDGCKPTLCDHLSFRTIVRNEWWAFGQFVRHFVFPLVLFTHRGLHCHEVFTIFRDGPTPHFMRALLGAKRFRSRHWLLTLEPTHIPHLQRRTSSGDSRRALTYHNNLYSVARWFSSGLNGPRRKRSAWATYNEHLDHYGDHAGRQKSDVVQRWLCELAPHWVTDLGCNIGTFSILATQCGANVIALDSDHDCIEALYKNGGHLPIFPVIASLDDLSGGRGWEGHEVPSLISRLEGRSDVLLMLGLLHHLMIASAIPLRHIVNLAKRLTKKYLIVELVSECDPMLIALCQQRDRQVAEFSLALQMHAFEMSFSKIHSVMLEGGARKLALYKKKG